VKKKISMFHQNTFEIIRFYLKVDKFSQSSSLQCGIITDDSEQLNSNMLCWLLSSLERLNSLFCPKRQENCLYINTTYQSVKRFSALSQKHALMNKQHPSQIYSHSQLSLPFVNLVNSIHMQIYLAQIDISSSCKKILCMR